MCASCRYIWVSLFFSLQGSQKAILGLQEPGAAGVHPDLHPLDVRARLGAPQVHHVQPVELIRLVRVGGKAKVEGGITLRSGSQVPSRNRVHLDLSGGHPVHGIEPAGIQGPARFHRHRTGESKGFGCLHPEIEKVAAEAMDNFKPFAIAGGSVLAALLLCLFGLRYTPW